MSTLEPRLVAICGGSGAGKSWLAARLQERLGKEAARLCLDDFYRDLSHLSPAQRARVNFDHPRSIDWGELERVIREARSGRMTRVPRYDFTRHTRLETGAWWRPKRIILLDGLWLLRRASVRRQCVFKVYLDCPECIRLERRLRRDVRERGRSEASIRNQFLGVVAPMHARYVAPQRRWADVVLEGNPDARQLEGLAVQIRDRLSLI